MLIKSDLRWNLKFFSLFSKLNLIPVSLKSGILIGQMENHDKSQIGSFIGFKLWQTLCGCYSIFLSTRTLDYVIGVGSGAKELGLDFLDFVPFMLMLCGGFSTVSITGHLIFDSGRELNTMIYNETLKLCGKKWPTQL